MIVQPIAVFHSPLTSKFGTPRQSGLVEGLRGEVVFMPSYCHPDFIRGLEGFDYIWLLWQFSANAETNITPTVRPPLLGGNSQMGVFATRSPFRPNPIGLSSVRVVEIRLDEQQGPVIVVEGADLIDGTPIIDIKPYVTYADCHQNARSGFVDEHPWKLLQVDMPDEVVCQLTTDEQQVLRQLLALDPRPHYHHDPTRIYGMPFGNYDVRFRVIEGVVYVLEIVEN
jgi:tRNA-Thr(GGU) m(6)t(6)A37 methyltransferase TsaA